MKTKLLIITLMLALVTPVGAISNIPLDGSSTITTGGTSQTVFDVNGSRRWLFIQNKSSETLYLNFNADAASSNSIKLVAGAAYETPANYCPTTTVTILGATTGSEFTAKQGN